MKDEKKEEQKESNQIDSGKVRINLWISDKMMKSIQDVCREEEKSISDVVRDSVRRFVRSYKRQSR